MDQAKEISNILKLFSKGKVGNRLHKLEGTDYGVIQQKFKTIIHIHSLILAILCFADEEEEEENNSLIVCINNQGTVKEELIDDLQNYKVRQMDWKYFYKLFSHDSYQSYTDIMADVLIGDG
jgi:hypothetical protein